MVSKAYETLTPRPSDLLIIENVGNLVCPASYDLGEDMRMVMLSVTEGEDKPLKYPVVFHSAQVVIVSKVDIAEVCGFDRDAALTNIRRVAPNATIFELSARTGLGMDDWYTYLKEKLPEQRKAVSVNDG
jgi:hydrogenase nickel incorporation protein HypB